MHGLWGFAQSDEQPKDGDFLGKASHAYSHFKLSVEFFTCKEEITVDGWFSLEEIKNLALSKIDEKLLDILISDGLSCKED